MIYIHEPTPLQCGQAVIAMIADVSVGDVVALLDNERETTLKEMRSALHHYGYTMSERKQFENKKDLPSLCVLSLETPRCWHWSLFADGIFYDPEHGVMDDVPLSDRKYYFGVEKAD
ncbi:MAG: hypothetical protein IJ251_04065 [Oscillospiraceae bacterium]|nr:hypothetical protein [Oscillospiraceae bacterium]